MKKLIKDVIGELKNPSEDGAKVLGVIRRVIVIALFLMAASTLVNLIRQGVVIRQIISDYMQRGGMQIITVLKEGPFLERMFEIFLNLIFYLILFIMCVKSTKHNKSIESKFFIIALAATVLFPSVFDIINGRGFLYILNGLLASVVIAGILWSGFYKFRESEQISQENISIRNIALFGYLKFFLYSTATLRLFIINIPIMGKLFAMDLEYAKNADIFGKIYLISDYTYYLLGFIVLAGLVLTIISRFKYSKGLKKAINILYIIYTLYVLLLYIPYGFIYNGVWWLLAFILATGYQNKYKVFDNLGSRIFKKSIEFIKVKFESYLSFKE